MWNFSLISLLLIILIGFVGVVKLMVANSRKMGMKMVMDYSWNKAFYWAGITLYVTIILLSIIGVAHEIVLPDLGEKFES